MRSQGVGVGGGCVPFHAEHDVEGSLLVVRHSTLDNFDGNKGEPLIY